MSDLIGIAYSCAARIRDLGKYEKDLDRRAALEKIKMDILGLASLSGITGLEKSVTDLRSSLKQAQDALKASEKKFQEFAVHNITDALQKAWEHGRININGNFKIDVSHKERAEKVESERDQLAEDYSFLKNQLRGIRDSKGLPLFDVAPIVAYFKKRDTREFLLKQERDQLAAGLEGMREAMVDISGSVPHQRNTETGKCVDSCAQCVANEWVAFDFDYKSILEARDKRARTEVWREAQAVLDDFKNDDGGLCLQIDEVFRGREAEAEKGEKG